MADETQVTTFKLTLETKDIDLENPDGSVRHCELRQLDGFNRDRYLEKEKTKVDQKAKVIKEYMDIQTMLVGMCLYEKGEKEPIPLPEIRKFPSTVVHSLFKMCQEMNAFGDQEKAEEEAKKD